MRNQRELPNYLIPQKITILVQQTIFVKIYSYLCNLLYFLYAKCVIYLWIYSYCVKFCATFTQRDWLVGLDHLSFAQIVMLYCQSLIGDKILAFKRFSHKFAIVVIYAFLTLTLKRQSHKSFDKYHVWFWGRQSSWGKVMKL